MKALRQVGFGMVIALVSAGLILGALALALAEGYGRTQPNSDLSPTASSPPFVPPPIANTLPPIASPIPPTSCSTPVGWVPYIVQIGDTLDSLALRYRISSESILLSNCLPDTVLQPGLYISVPSAPAATAIPCHAPYDWVLYTVQPGDNLFRIGLAYGIAVPQLQAANCMGYSTTIYSGKQIYVPPWATLTPTITPTFTSTATSTATATATVTPTASHTATPTVTYTATSTPTSTMTPSETATPSPTATFTDTSPPG